MEGLSRRYCLEFCHPCAARTQLMSGRLVLLTLACLLGVQINGLAAHQRAFEREKSTSDAELVSTFLQDTDSWKPGGHDLGAVAVLTGQASQEELRYLKSVSMQLWLFGYELTGAPPSCFFEC